MKARVGLRWVFCTGSFLASSLDKGGVRLNRSIPRNTRLEDFDCAAIFKRTKVVVARERRTFLALSRSLFTFLVAQTCFEQRSRVLSCRSKFIVVSFMLHW